MKESLIEKAVSFGATLAGIAGAQALRDSPSHKACAELEWPKQAGSALVLALAHQETEPELDWWGGDCGTAGNKRLHTVSGQLKQWLRKELGVDSWVLPYQPEKSGILLKDAAVLAGLGTIGANNLLVTPKYGPRVRLRALFLDAELEPTGPIDFSPCGGCPMPCWKTCPRQAFASGSYDAARCRLQMREDESKRSAAAGVKYCRACELSCPAGRVPRPRLSS